MNPEKDGPSLGIKVEVGGEFRRYWIFQWFFFTYYNQTCSTRLWVPFNAASLHAAVAELTGIPAPQKITYRDEDGDSVTISSDIDLPEAMRLSLATKTRTLTISVKPTNEVHHKKAWQTQLEKNRSQAWKAQPSLAMAHRALLQELRDTKRCWSKNETLETLRNTGPCNAEQLSFAGNNLEITTNVQLATLNPLRQHAGVQSRVRKTHLERRLLTKNILLFAANRIAGWDLWIVISLWENLFNEKCLLFQNLSAWTPIQQVTLSLFSCVHVLIMFAAAQPRSPSFFGKPIASSSKKKIVPFIIGLSVFISFAVYGQTLNHLLQLCVEEQRVVKPLFAWEYKRNSKRMAKLS